MVFANSFSCYALVLLPLSAREATAFALTAQGWTVGRSETTKTRLAACLDDNRYEAAAAPLGWETLEESSARPVLNLSRRNDSPEDYIPKDKVEDDASSSSSSLPMENWDEQWQQETCPGLVDLGILPADDNAKQQQLALLDKCPQLLRLPPTLILETASWLVDKFSPRYAAMEPRLLSFRRADVEYALEFLGTMMMMSNTNAVVAACAASPAFLLSGVEGGIQERAVEKALGAAGSATTAANQKIAGDAVQAWNQIRQQQRKPKGL